MDAPMPQISPKHELIARLSAAGLLEHPVPGSATAPDPRVLREARVRAGKGRPLSEIVLSERG
jgi:hypothetical protein